MEHYNGFPTHTKVEAPLLKDANGSESKRDWSISYASVMGMTLYLTSKTRIDILFSVHLFSGLHITPRHHTGQL